MAILNHLVVNGGARINGNFSYMKNGSVINGSALTHYVIASSAPAGEIGKIWFQPHSESGRYYINIWNGKS
jgi:hypothetical protein